MSNRRNGPGFVALFLAALFALAMLFSIAMIYQNSLKKSEVIDSSNGKTIWNDGVAYFPRQDVRTLLLIGVDRDGPAVDSGSYNNNGMADVVMLVIFDDSAKQYQVLALNRDTMVDMPVLGIGGKKIGTDYAQIALSHSYGNGLSQSCENTLSTVSQLLNGFLIDNYMSMSMDVVRILTDAVGGVRVNVTDDFSQVDSTITTGELVLNGQQAINFVRLRHGVADQLNTSRMNRHEAYVNGFLEAFNKKVDGNASVAMDIYEEAAPYIVTDCSDRLLTDLFDRFIEYTLAETIIPEGENIQGEKYMEFYLDEQKFQQLVLDLLYKEKK